MQQQRDNKSVEPLFIGQDFNVGAMAATIYVKRVNGCTVLIANRYI